MVSFKHDILKVSTLKKRSEFLSVAAQRNSYRKNSIIVSVSPYVADKADDLKIGLVVTKKVGNAVVRNKVKRRLREALRILLKNEVIVSKIKQMMPMHLVFIANRQTVQSLFSDIISDISEGLCFLPRKSKKIAEKPEV